MALELPPSSALSSFLVSLHSELMLEKVGVPNSSP